MTTTLRRAKRRQSPPRRGSVAVIGLGYVGLPLACLASEKGWKVFGIARDKEKIAQINTGHSPVREPGLDDWLKRVSVEATDDYRVVAKVSVVVICVPTPVDELHNPDLTPVIDACRRIRPYLKRGHVIILESTVNPGVSEEIVKPLLEQTGLRADRDFVLAHCPERIDPGNRRWNVRNIPRVVGATNDRGLKKALQFYRSILESPVKAMKSIKEAEAVKILENSFRDVNIAFVNEIARSFARMGIDTLDVIEGAKTKPFGFFAFFPSAGIGGHCIPVDPYYLIERARRSGFNHQFLKLAREINNSMPEYAVDLLVRTLNAKGRSMNSVRVGLLGVAYKANVADTRESPTFQVMKILQEYDTRFEIFDPHVPSLSTVSSLPELLRRSEALILMTDHKEFQSLTGPLLKRAGIMAIIDGKNFLDKEGIRRRGIVYRGIGR